MRKRGSVNLGMAYFLHVQQYEFLIVRENYVNKEGNSKCLHNFIYHIPRLPETTLQLILLTLLKHSKGVI